MKKPQKPTTRPEKATELPPDDLDTAIAWLHVEVPAAFARAKKSNKGLRDAVSLMAEQRKLFALRDKRGQALTMPMVLAWIRNLDDEERGKLDRELHSMGKRAAGVLGT